jgi:hypothetical protein
MLLFAALSRSHALHMEGWMHRRKDEQLLESDIPWHSYIMTSCKYPSYTP